MTDQRINRLNLYAAGIMNIQIARHPLKVLCTVVYNKTERDIYGDLERFPEGDFTKKFAILQNDKNLQYVPDTLEDLRVEDEETPYWYVIMTISKLRRALKAGDFIEVSTKNFKSLYPALAISCLPGVDKISFEITDVRPVNSRLQSVIVCVCHPTKETFNLYPE